MSLRGNAAKLSASPSASHARDECVRAVVQHTRKPYANAIGGGVVGGQADRGSADRQRPGTDVKQMNDDVAARRGAPLVHYEPVEHVAMTRAGVSRPRAEPRHEQMGSDDARRRRRERRPLCERSRRQRRPSPGNERRKQRQQQHRPDRGQNSRSLHAVSLCSRCPVYLRWQHRLSSAPNPPVNACLAADCRAPVTRRATPSAGCHADPQGAFRTSMRPSPARASEARAFSRN